MESADRVLRVLEVFGPAERELSLSDIAERMQLPKSSVHRLLGTLISRGFVERDSQNHRYSLGIRLFEVGSNVIHGRGLHAAAHPILEELTMSTGETSHLAVGSGTEAVYVYKLDGPSAIQMPSRVGGRAPGHATSIGKVLLAWGGSDLRRQMDGVPLRPYTVNTITDLDGFDAELELVRSRGYATDMEEFEIGLRCVAAPVHDMTDRVIAAVGIAAPAIRLNEDAMSKAVEAVTGAGMAISRQLGHIRGTARVPRAAG
ncbi:MAG TPA: IclR family transcriptional regulator [Candidatus Dormibacteraeota bacterium]|nr:IclR family transcriptional regulator [Candidatus Dormibacteraeota bacterium]